MSIVKQLRGVTYRRSDLAEHNRREQVGFIAQEVEKVLPQVVLTANDDMQTR